MTITTIDLSTNLLEQAKELTGKTTNNAVVDYALRWLIASKQKTEMLAGIRELQDFPVGVNAPKIDYPLTTA